MKLLVVLSIKESRKKVAAMMQQAGVEKFSVIDIAGYKNAKDNISWFAGSDSDAIKTTSILAFSFTTEEIAKRVISEITSCNIETENSFPAHAYILDVEEFSKIM